LRHWSSNFEPLTGMNPHTTFSFHAAPRFHHAREWRCIVHAAFAHNVELMDLLTWMPSHVIIMVLVLYTDMVKGTIMKIKCRSQFWWVLTLNVESQNTSTDWQLPESRMHAPENRSHIGAHDARCSALC
jgi:hypothetical protein